MSLTKWFNEKWVDISTKKDGKHPACGRKMGDGRSYPKCVPSSKANRMSIKEKRIVRLVAKRRTISPAATTKY